MAYCWKGSSLHSIGRAMKISGPRVAEIKNIALAKLKLAVVEDGHHTDSDRVDMLADEGD